MTAWKMTVDVSDLWIRDLDTEDFEPFRDSIVERFKASKWYAKSDYLRYIIMDLAESAGVDEFDDWWDEMYNLADDERVWVKTV